MTRIRPPSDQEARDVIREVYGLCKIRLVEKSSDAMSQAIAAALGELRKLGLNVPSGEDYLLDYATTLPDFLGTGVAVVGWPAPLATIGAGDVYRACHEGTHAQEIAEDGAVPFAVGYLASRTARALYEFRAVASADELHLAMGDELESPATHAERFRCYALDDARVAMIAGALTSAQATLRGGVSVCATARAFKSALASRGILA